MVERNPHKMAIKFNTTDWKVKVVPLDHQHQTMCQSIRVVNYEFDLFKCFGRDDGSNKNYDVWLSSLLWLTDCYQISFRIPDLCLLLVLTTNTTNRSHTCCRQKLRLFILEEIYHLNPYQIEVLDKFFLLINNTFWCRYECLSVCCISSL